MQVSDLIDILSIWIMLQNWVLCYKHNSLYNYCECPLWQKKQDLIDTILIRWRYEIGVPFILVKTSTSICLQEPLFSEPHGNNNSWNTVWVFCISSAKSLWNPSHLYMFYHGVFWIPQKIGFSIKSKYRYIIWFYVTMKYNTLKWRKML